VVARVIEECPELDLHVTAFEVDEPLVAHLNDTLQECVAVASGQGVRVEFDVRDASFVEYATGWLFEVPEQFDAVIANPPYKKVNANYRVTAKR
jgi:16S rRNA A1518/A1519 N6-dimethyltransferase RsmA/KsgA/DIM1 with predicted DNA glycosylase/AP lyase activity